MDRSTRRVTGCYTNLVDAALEGLTLYMMIGIVIVIAISQYNRVIGGILGVCFWIAVAVVGGWNYDRGGAMGIPNYAFSRAFFYGVCILFGAFSAGNAYNAYRRRTPRPSRPSEEE